MATIDILNKMSDGIEKVFANISFLAFFIALLFAVEQVFSRNLFDFTYPWAEEVIVYLMLFALFMLAPLATKRGTHITLDLLPYRWKRVKAVLSWVSLFLELVTVIFLFGIYYQHLLNLYETESVLMSGLEFPLWVVQSSVGVAFAGIIFMCIVNLFKKIMPTA